MSYVSEIIEYSPVIKDIDDKIRALTERKKSEGYRFVSRSLVGNAFAIVVFARI